MPALCSKCGAPLPESAYSFSCAQCGTSIFDSGPVTAQPTFSIPSELEGIGGWLILVAIQLAVAPFAMAYSIYSDFNVLNDSRYAQILSDHPGAANMLVSEIIARIFFIVAVIVLNYLFYSKSKIFPSVMIGYLFLQMIVVLGQNYTMSALLGPGQYSFASGGAIGGFSIWTTYLSRSKRVKATFVR